MSGKKPKDMLFQYYWDEDDILLFAAFAHGMNEGDVIHRMSISTFIQTHVTTKGLMPIQRALEKSRYWQCEEKGTGLYKLTNSGYGGCKGRFGVNDHSADLDWRYRLFVKRRERLFIVIVAPNQRKTHLYVKDTSGFPTSCSGREFDQKLKASGVNAFVSKTAPQYFQDWIIQQEDFFWERQPLSETLFRNMPD
jgi:hypothetical protein